MADPDTPDLDEYYRIKVKMPDDLGDDPSKVQQFLTELASKIHDASGEVHIEEDQADPVGHDRAGDAWAKGTLAVPLNLGCGSKKGGDWGGDGDDGGDDEPG
jgi:hypothetical protein